MLQGVVVYVDDLIIMLLSILSIVEKYHRFPKFHLLKPNGAGSLFHGILVIKFQGFKLFQFSTVHEMKNEFLEVIKIPLYVSNTLNLNEIEMASHFHN